MNFTKSDIRAGIDAFRNEGREDLVARLRTAAIRHLFLQDEHLNKHSYIFELLKEEREELDQRFICFGGSEMNEYLERDKKQNKEFSTFNTFLLLKYGIFNPNDKNVQRMFKKERTFTRRSQSDTDFAEFLMLFYFSQIEKKDLVSDACRLINGRLVPGYKEAVLQGDSTVVIEEKYVENIFNNVVDWSSPYDMNYMWIRDLLLGLIAVNMALENVENVKYYVMKWLSMTNEDNSNSYWTVKLIEKEYADK